RRRSAARSSGARPRSGSGDAAAPLAVLLQRLALDAERGHGAGPQAVEADVAAALLAAAVGAVVDAPEGLVDLGDELPLAVADAQHQVAVALEQGAIRRIRELLAVLPHAVHGTQGLADHLLPPLFEELWE